MKKELIIALSFLFTINSWGQQLPFQNPDLNAEVRSKDLLSG